MKFAPFFILISCLLILSCGTPDPQETHQQGLVGTYYGNEDFTNIKESEVITGLDLTWDEETGHGNSWSGVWEGMVIPPASGPVTFYLSSNKRASLQISSSGEITTDEMSGVKSKIVNMVKEKSIPIKVSFQYEKGGEGFLKVTWSWEEHPAVSVPPANLYFTAAQGRRWNWIIEPDPAKIDYSKFLVPRAHHVIVYHAPERFCGWPANNGIWSWGDEILVGFTLAYYQEKQLHHSVDESRPSKAVLARSTDGGESWILEDPENFAGDGGSPATQKSPINFANPGFALRNDRENFFYSYDRGKTWNGPFRYPQLVKQDLTSRTDYLVESDTTCLFFLSAEEEQVKARLQDRTFCARTTDGALSFEFLSWITDSIKVRSVMPSTVRVAQNHLVTALRRRFDERFENKPGFPHNWIDVYESLDNGKTWHFLSKVADTDRGKHNGNPPSLVRLQDGRLVVTYAFRGVPYGIRAKISRDNGKSWGEEIHLRDDGRTFDLGYTRSVQRMDGKIATVYYFTTDQLKEQHIAATIWDPDSMGKSTRRAGW